MKIQILKLYLNGLNCFAPSSCLLFLLFYAKRCQPQRENCVFIWNLNILNCKAKGGEKNERSSGALSPTSRWQQKQMDSEVDVKRRRNGPITAGQTIMRKWTRLLLSSTHFALWDLLFLAPSRALWSDCRRVRVCVQVCRPAEISCCRRWRRRSSGSGRWPWPGCSGGSPTGLCPPPECGCWATAASSPRPSSARGQVRKKIVAVPREDASHTY